MPFNGVEGIVLIQSVVMELVMAVKLKLIVQKTVHQAKDVPQIRVLIGVMTTSGLYMVVMHMYKFRGYNLTKYPEIA